MALRSAWELHRYLAPVSRQCLASTSSRTPRGKPLKPVDLISLSGPTTTAPTRRPFSLLQRAISCATSMNLSSQPLENIANPSPPFGAFIKTRFCKAASASTPVGARGLAASSSLPSPASGGGEGGGGETPAPSGGEDGDWPG